MCELLVGLPEVLVHAVAEWPSWLFIAITTGAPRSVCECGGDVHGHGVRAVDLVDLPVFGRPARLGWRKQRWRCTACATTWTEHDPRIASARCQLTTRAAWWATFKVGRHGRTVSEVADDLGCGWHAVMDAVELYGTELINDPARIGAVPSLGFDKTLFCREGPFRTQCWSTQIVDVGSGRLLDVVPGRDATGPCRWLAEQPDAWAGGDPGGRRWTCHRRVGACCTRCCPTPSRSPIRST